MKGILILAHGSTRKETNRILDSLVQKVKAGTENIVMGQAYLQLADPDIETGIAKMAAQGVTEIVAVPLFIFDGVHVTTDIPDELKRVGTLFPNISIAMAKHIGDDDKLAEIVLERALNTKI